MGGENEGAWLDTDGSVSWICPTATNISGLLLQNGRGFGNDKGRMERATKSG